MQAIINLVKPIITAKIKEQCDVAVEDMSILSPEEFALCRRNGLGASDCSVYLGLQARWRTEDDLVRNKLEKVWTKEEQDVGEKIQVQMGNYLEPLILLLAEKELGFPIIKPKQMFRLRDYPYLTINFDGVCYINDTLFASDAVFVPVEAKYVTFYGDKYYKWTEEYGKGDYVPPTDYDERSIVEHCTDFAGRVGIPDYYYAQVQQELLGVGGAEYGYLAALRGKSSEFKLFKVLRDPWLQTKIILEGHRVTNKIKRMGSLA